MKSCKSNDRCNGFTMIELIIVLVLMGIVATAAVPKFFDMRSASEIKAAKTILAEAQLRINSGYSKARYAGRSCDEAWNEVNTIGKISDRKNGQQSTEISGFKFVKPEISDELKAGVENSVQVQGVSGGQTVEGFLTLPACTDVDSSSGSGSSGGETSSSDSKLTCPEVGSIDEKCEGTARCTNGTCTCTCSCNNGVTSCECDVDSDSASTGEYCAISAYVSGIKCVTATTKVSDGGKEIKRGSVIATLDGIYIANKDIKLTDQAELIKMIKDPTSVSGLIKLGDKKEKGSGCSDCYRKVDTGDFYLSEDDFMFVWTEGKTQKTGTENDAWLQLVSQ